MFFASLILLALAFLLFWLSGRQRAASGLPGGRIIYSDTGAWGKVDKPLYDAQLGLTGKPDYLVEENGQIIPVEVKSSRAPNAPYDSHIFQVAAYCLLVEKSFGDRPPYGIIHYQDKDFAVDYTPELENALMDVLADMRRDEYRSEVRRSHAFASRCSSCGFAEICDQRLN